MKKFAFWNNKGGVGKSTLCFHTAAEYAKTHPSEMVLVIDVCPQANVSTMFLGGGTDNKGEDKLLELIDNSSGHSKTIVGYFADRLSTSPTNRPYTEYLINPFENGNAAIPENLYLLAGDGNLELVAPVLTERAFTRATLPDEEPWLVIHNYLNEFLKGLQGSFNNKEITVFLDTNPAFSIYTEIAISTAKELLIPLNADDSSRQGFKALTSLIYGIGQLHPVWKRYNYSSYADDKGLERPKIKLLLGNRFTSYTSSSLTNKPTGTAKAFERLNDTIIDTAYDIYKKNMSIFSTQQIETKEVFVSEFTHAIRDFNSAGVVSAFNGLPLGSLPDNQASYKINNAGDKVQIEKDQRDKCRDSIRQIVQKL
jgi:cellulose biosynthesis protein BcsQ